MRTSTVTACLALSFAAGCAPRLALPDVTPEELAYPARDRFPDAAAVVLREEERVVVDLRGLQRSVDLRIEGIDQGAYGDPGLLSHPRRLEVDAVPLDAPPVGEHRTSTLVIAILDGARASSIELCLGSDARDAQVHGRARVIGKSGVVRSVDEAELLARAPCSDALSASERRPGRRAWIDGLATGDVVELGLTVERPLATDISLAPLLPEYPVARFRVDATIDPLLGVDAHVWDAGAALERRDTASGHHFSLALRDRPAALASVATAPLAGPLVTLRLVELDAAGGPVQLGGRTWATALAPLVERGGPDGELRRGAADLVLPAAASAACAGDVSCLASLALATARERVHLTPRRPLFARPLPAVVASGVATEYELALLTIHFLDAAHVIAAPAFQRRASGALDHEHPFPPALDTALVYLPEQPGLATSLWLDPACATCQPGELRPGAVDEALVVTTHSKPGAAGPHVAAAFVSIAPLSASAAPLSASAAPPPAVHAAEPPPAAPPSVNTAPPVAAPPPR